MNGGGEAVDSTVYVLVGDSIISMVGVSKGIKTGSMVGLAIMEGNGASISEG